ncbi:TIGR02300 family protein [Agrobacterium vaccinii]|uniref:TIGR02300 family protein n=1 Tax=Agrobacterium TaxID=357 RepID=UPI000DCF9795|nr:MULTISPECIES: TIGR02300 family protein [Agrobacterium]UHS58607.1 TIGR02300 family protein [Agrobacterium vaccinii]UHS63321.1 TIGR02300 family protein [Agrobacterium vaccinii]
MAKADLGTKRTDPDTGKKFYDLNRDPIVSPYSGKSWPLSFFEETTAAKKMEQQAEEEEVAEVDTENTEVELVPLEDADGDTSGDDIPDIEGDDDVELDDDDDTFLEADEDDEDDDVSGIIGVSDDDET